MHLKILHRCNHPKSSVIFGFYTQRARPQVCAGIKTCAQTNRVFLLLRLARPRVSAIWLYTSIEGRLICKVKDSRAKQPDGCLLTGWQQVKSRQIDASDNTVNEQSAGMCGLGVIDSQQHLVMMTRE